jgi:hypothetical protein
MWCPETIVQQTPVTGFASRTAIIVILWAVVFRGTNARVRHTADAVLAEFVIVAWDIGAVAAGDHVIGHAASHATVFAFFTTRCAAIVWCPKTIVQQAPVTRLASWTAIVVILWAVVFRGTDARVRHTAGFILAEFVSATRLGAIAAGNHVGHAATHVTVFPFFTTRSTIMWRPETVVQQTPVTRLASRTTTIVILWAVVFQGTNSCIWHAAGPVLADFVSIARKIRAVTAGNHDTIIIWLANAQAAMFAFSTIRIAHVPCKAATWDWSFLVFKFSTLAPHTSLRRHGQTGQHKRSELHVNL